MSLEEREGVLDQLTEKGIILSGTRLSYSKWFEGERPKEDALGHKVTVVIDRKENWQFLKRVLTIGEKVAGWKPPEAGRNGFWGGGGRRMSPEELELKRAERIQIARSVSIDRAIDMAEKGITIEKIAPQAKVIEEYLLSGKLPIGQAPKGNGHAAQGDVPEAPPQAPGKKPEPKMESVPAAEEQAEPAASRPSPKPRRSSGQAVNALFNEARRAGLVADWKAYADLIGSLPGLKAKVPYALSAEEFAKVEAYVRKAMVGSQVA
jgi:hypothetical protein